MKRTIALFDFDGTLIKKDSFLLLILSSQPLLKIVAGGILLSPYLLLQKVGLMDSGKAKEKVFSYFFKGIKLQQLESFGQRLKDKLHRFENKTAVNLLQKHRERGHEVSIVSASMKQWIKPWAEEHGVTKIIASVPDVRDGIVTGKFSGRNCNNEEKCNRIQLEYDLGEYDEVHAYGNSKGDAAMLKLATHSYLLKKGKFKKLN